MDRQQLGRRHLGRLDLVVVHVGVTEAPALPRDRVLAELRESCRRRATADQLLDIPGAFGVLDGVAPVVFVTDDRPTLVAATVPKVAPAVHEIYVAIDAKRCRASLEGQGWLRGAEVEHVVHTPGDLSLVPGAHAQLTELTDKDVERYIEGLALATAIPRHVLVLSYPPDFLERAAPVRLLGAFDAAGRLVGGVATRRQIDGALLFGLWVAPSARRRGLGSALAEAALTASYADGAVFCHAQVGDASRSLVASLGMRACTTWVRYARSTPIG